MTKPIRPNQKASDEDILRLNALSYSLTSIGQQLGCHPSTITQRLDRLGVKVADTRRSFMEDIYKDLPPNVVDWVATTVGPHTPIKSLITNLLLQEYLRTQAPAQKEFAHAA